jgi:hypothetical protein
MNLLMAIVLFSGLDLYFLKDSPDLLVRVFPEMQTEQITIYYSFSGANWHSIQARKVGKFFDAVMSPVEGLDIVGFYAVYDNDKIDNNDGKLYLYEIKKSPRMIMPISFSDLEVILSQAKRKIDSNEHIDEAIQLLEYVGNTLIFVPIIKDGPSELRKNALQAEVENLKKQIGI